MGIISLCVSLVMTTACSDDGAADDTFGDVEPLAYGAPIDSISTYLNGMHIYNGDSNEQVEAHHYVKAVSDGVWQALIYDGTSADARLMGVEYIISENLFEQLPEDEKLLWHSHGYEVKSGLLIAPGMEAGPEHRLMTRLVSTYGKTWHFWHTDRGDVLPIGIPTLMMAFTADGQVNLSLLEARDERFGVDSEDIADRRRDIPEPTIDPAADAWTYGTVVRLEAVVEQQGEDE